MKTIYFWWSSSEIHSGTLIRWKQVRKYGGGFAVCPVIKTWLFGGWRLQCARSRYQTGDEPPSKRTTANWFRRIRGGERVGFGVLEPHISLYASYNNAYQCKNELTKPSLKEFVQLIRRRKAHAHGRATNHKKY